MELLDSIIDEIGEDEKQPMADLADALGVFIEQTGQFSLAAMEGAWPMFFDRIA